MNIIEKQEEIEDLLFSIDLNVDMLTDEKTKYLVFSQYYFKKIVNSMNGSNVGYLYVKINNLLFSINQLMYEADVEQRFWLEFIKLTKDPKFVYIFDDIVDDIEQLLVIFSQHAMNRFDFCNEYQDVLNDYINNGFILDDSYYKSDVDRREYIDLLNKYNVKLLKLKK